MSVDSNTYSSPEAGVYPSEFGPATGGYYPGPPEPQKKSRWRLALAIGLPVAVVVAGGAVVAAVALSSGNEWDAWADENATTLAQLDKKASEIDSFDGSSMNSIADVKAAGATFSEFVELLDSLTDMPDAAAEAIWQDQISEVRAAATGLTAGAAALESGDTDAATKAFNEASDAAEEIMDTSDVDKLKDYVPEKYWGEVGLED